MQVVFDMIINRDYEKLPEHVDSEIRNLIEKMLSKDPNRRPNIWELEKIPAIEEKIKLFYSEHPDEVGGMEQLSEINEVKEESKKEKKKKEQTMEELTYTIKDGLQYTIVEQGVFNVS